MKFCLFCLTLRLSVSLGTSTIKSNGSPTWLVAEQEQQHCRVLTSPAVLPAVWRKEQGSSSWSRQKRRQFCPESTCCKLVPQQLVSLFYFLYLLFFFKGRQNHHIPNLVLKTKINFYCLKLLNKVGGFNCYLSPTNRSPNAYNIFVLKKKPLHFNF